MKARHRLVDRYQSSLLYPRVTYFNPRAEPSHDANRILFIGKT